MNLVLFFCGDPTKEHVMRLHRDQSEIYQPVRSWLGMASGGPVICAVDMFDVLECCACLVNRPTVEATRRTYASRGVVGSRPVKSAMRFRRYRTVFG
jgi:hypothetical protein